MLQEFQAHPSILETVSRLDSNHYLTTDNNGYVRVWEYGSTTHKWNYHANAMSFSTVYKGLAYTASQLSPTKLHVWDFTSFPATVPTAPAETITTLVPVYSGRRYIHLASVAATDTCVVVGTDYGYMNIVKLK